MTYLLLLLKACLLWVSFSFCFFNPLMRWPTTVAVFKAFDFLFWVVISLTHPFFGGVGKWGLQILQHRWCAMFYAQTVYILWMQNSYKTALSFLNVLNAIEWEFMSASLSLLSLNCFPSNLHCQSQGMGMRGCLCSEVAVTLKGSSHSWVNWGDGSLRRFCPCSAYLNHQTSGRGRVAFNLTGHSWVNWGEAWEVFARAVQLHLSHQEQGHWRTTL